MDGDADEQRADLRDGWEAAAPGWGARADRMRALAMPVSRWMIDAIRPQPGYTVLELAAGPGDTGFLAAELVAPGGTLISSDVADAMVDVARARAATLGLGGGVRLEFRRLELEWIDLETASVDAALCRWGLMFALDVEAALREIRRVVRSHGRLALATWDAIEHNPWCALGTALLAKLGHMPPPDPVAPGPFRLSDAEALEELIAGAGFTEVEVRPLAIAAHYADIDDYHATTHDLSVRYRQAYDALDDDGRRTVREALVHELEAFTQPDGSIVLPGRPLVASATA